jgi:hypothetical protein
MVTAPPPAGMILMSLSSLQSGNDTVYIEHDGHRHGPYTCAFSTKPLMLFYDRLNVDEGDKVIRLLHEKELIYTVKEVDYYSGGGAHSRLAPHYELTISKDSALPTSSLSTTTNHISIHGSTGIQIGDHNVQNLQVALKEVLASIDNADAPREDREEAKSRLNAFLEHPLVAAAVGAGLPVALGLLS